MMPRASHRRIVLGALLGLSVLGCDDTDVIATLGPGGFFNDRSANLLVGRWFRVESAPSLVGIAVTTETEWRFDSDGAAIRTITTRTALGDVIESSQTRVAWQAAAGTLILDFGPPSFRIVRVGFSVEVRVDGTILFLDGLPYLRAGP